MYLPERGQFQCLEEQLWLINAIVSLSIFSLPLWILMVGLAQRRLQAVCSQSKRPDLCIRGENKAHLTIILYLILYLTVSSSDLKFSKSRIVVILSSSPRNKRQIPKLLYAKRNRFSIL